MDKPLNEEEWKDAVYELAYDRLVIGECPKCKHPYVYGWACSWCGFKTKDKMAALGFKIDRDIICSCCFEKLVKFLKSAELQKVAENDICSSCGYAYGRNTARIATKSLISGFK